MEKQFERWCALKLRWWTHFTGLWPYGQLLHASPGHKCITCSSHEAGAGL